MASDLVYDGVPWNNTKTFPGNTRFTMVFGENSMFHSWLKKAQNGTGFFLPKTIVKRVCPAKARCKFTTTPS